MIDELKDSGGQRALYTALLGALRASDDPSRASKSALQAVERELVELLNTPQQFAAWLPAFQDMHEQLKKYLRAEFGEQ
jgi:hypothetical protein